MERIFDHILNKIHFVYAIVEFPKDLSGHLEPLIFPLQSSSKTLFSTLDHPG